MKYINYTNEIPVEMKKTLLTNKFEPIEEQMYYYTKNGTYTEYASNEIIAYKKIYWNISVYPSIYVGTIQMILNTTMTFYPDIGRDGWINVKLLPPIIKSEIKQIDETANGPTKLITTSPNYDGMSQIYGTITYPTPILEYWIRENGTITLTQETWKYFKVVWLYYDFFTYNIQPQLSTPTVNCEIGIAWHSTASSMDFYHVVTGPTLNWPGSTFSGIYYFDFPMIVLQWVFTGNKLSGIQIMIPEFKRVKKSETYLMYEFDLTQMPVHNATFFTTGAPSTERVGEADGLPAFYYLNTATFTCGDITITDNGPGVNPPSPLQTDYGVYVKNNTRTYDFPIYKNN